MEDIGSLGGLNIPNSLLTRFIPTPRSSSGLSFQKVLGTVSSLASSAGDLLPGGLDPTYLALLQEQIQVQQQLFLMSLYSNIEKSKHETQMAAVRNIRPG